MIPALILVKTLGVDFVAYFVVAYMSMDVGSMINQKFFENKQLENQ